MSCKVIRINTMPLTFDTFIHIDLYRNVLTYRVYFFTGIFSKFRELPFPNYTIEMINYNLFKNLFIFFESISSDEKKCSNKDHKIHRVWLFLWEWRNLHVANYVTPIKRVNFLHDFNCLDRIHDVICAWYTDNYVYIINIFIQKPVISHSDLLCTTCTVI